MHVPRARPTTTTRLRRLVAAVLLAFGGFGSPVEAGEAANRKSKAMCRSCGSGGLMDVLSLGMTPLTDAYVPPDRAGDPEPRYPLDVAFCPSCTLVQILYSVPPSEMFEEYSYYSSVSEALLAHSKEHARRLMQSRALGPHSLVVEVASNDGYLLRNFVEAGIPVLGIDPAKGPAEAAEAIGAPTLREFFGSELAASLRSEGKRADVVLANNVLAHVPDLNGFVKGIATILTDEGVAEIETPYVRDLIDNLEFDTVYHEHLCYYSVTALDALFRRHRLSLNHLEHLPIHGGSLRLTISRSSQVTDTVRAYLEDEAAAGLTSFDFYRGFADRVAAVQHNLREALRALKSAGERIAAYGAAAKGTILLNSSGIGPGLVDFVADKSPHKQNRLLPGVQIPIVSPERIIEEMPGYILLLAWNFKDEILREQRAYLEAGGKFIIPLPAPEIVGKEDLGPSFMV